MKKTPLAFFTYPASIPRLGYMSTAVLSLLIFNNCLMPANAFAQKRPAYDSTYYISFRQDFIGRVYLSEKYSHIGIKELSTGERYSYRPNTKHALGVGFTYKPLTVNFGYGFGFLNTDKSKGISKSLDIKSHVYSNKWVMDLYGQYYRGFYAFPTEINIASAQRYYVRPDLKVLLGGASAYRVLNNRQFSYRSAFIQDTWQRKSAGSLMLGLAAFYTSFEGDSSFSPSQRVHLQNNRDINSVNIIQFGPGVGYAYHLVLPANLFLMGSVNASINANLVTESGKEEETRQLSINPALLYRAAAGYSDGTWNFNISWFNQQLPAKGASSGNKYIMNTGNVRLTFARRITLGDRGKRFFKPISWLNISL